jgi:hypothetical protein
MNTDIHRLLDEAFAGLEMTPDAQDLKEEIRANLLARVAELEASGRTPKEAARLAIDELGDIRALVEAEIPGPGWVTDASTRAGYLRNRVKPRPGFVVRTVVAALAAAVGLLLTALSLTGLVPLPVGVVYALLGLGATGSAWLVGDSLLQDTTTNHPMPAGRAAGFFFATFAAVYGLGLVGMVAAGVLDVWGIVFGALCLVAAIVLFAWLGATQTNRHKAWFRELQRDGAHVGNRFEDEPETAARFGIYTAVIWTVAFAVTIVFVFTIGWWWGLLVLVGAFAAMLLLLARMLFGPRKSG